MRKKDILELKRRLKKDDCTFTRMCGCYVNGEKNPILKFNQTFLTLQDEEFFKYLEIAKKTLSGTIGNNLLELNFPIEEEINPVQYSLLELKKSKLKDDALLDKFYQSIINNYDYEGNFLILIFHDAYDVMTKTSDNRKLDESEEVYEYILCAICPVSLSKPGLRYFEDNNSIGLRIRDWVVELPSLGFVYPAFIERSADVSSIMYYTKNAKDPHPELMEGALGCSSKQTATEQKEVFTNIICKALGNDDEKTEKVLMEIHDNLNTMIDEHNSINDKDSEPMILTTNTIQEVLAESGVSEEITTKIEKSYSEEFGNEPPKVEHIIDSKILAAKEQRKKEEKLEKQVEILQNKLDRIAPKLEALENVENEGDDSEIATEISSEEIEDNTSYDVVVKVKPEKVPQIKSQVIDGQNCLIIPIEENEQTNIIGNNE